MKNLLIQNKFAIFFLLVSIVALSISGFIKISYSQNYLQIGFNQNIPEHDALISQLLPLEPIDKTLLETKIDKYLEEKNSNSDRWMAFMTILSTVFAVFFVYSGFKIDNTVKAVDGHEKRMRDIHEYTVQLEYCMSFIIQKQYNKAIDALEVLRREGFVWNDSYKKNTCNFFLSHCYYERGIIEKSLDDLTLAVQYINEAIPDESAHPFKLEIIAKFNELDKIKT